MKIFIFFFAAEAFFKDFIDKYGLTNMYSAGLYNYPTEEEKWAYWARHIRMNRWDAPATELYRRLLKLVLGKEYFVITTNVDGQKECGIAHFDNRLLRAYSYEQTFAVMRGLRLTYKEAQEMFRRMVFNVVVRNQDDHTKNISFLMDSNGKWRLSPAYDMGYAYNPDGTWTSAHQMSINGKFSDITKEDLLECAGKNNIKSAAQIIEEVCEAASKWPDIARECEVPEKMIEAILPNMIFF